MDIEPEPEVRRNFSAFMDKQKRNRVLAVKIHLSGRENCAVYTRLFLDELNRKFFFFFFIFTQITTRKIYG